MASLKERLLLFALVGPTDKIIIIIIHNILRGGLQSPRGGFQEGPLRK